MSAATSDITVRAPGTTSPTALEIRSGIFQGFGTRHVALVLVFGIAFDFLGQLGWMDFNLVTFATRLHGFRQLPVHLAIGFGAVLSAVAAENLIDHERFRLARYPIAVLGASTAGTIILLIWTKYVYSINEKEAAALLFLGDVRLQLLALEFLRAAYVSVLVIALYAVFEASRRADAQLHAVRIAALSAEHGLVEGNLRAMQARVDPELLFDSLREVNAAYARDLASGQERLDALIRFLRAALPGESATSSTVAREQELALAYVALVAAQDGATARLEFQADAEALGEAMPSMLLLPLVRWVLADGSAERLRVRIKRCGGRTGNPAAGNRAAQSEVGLEICVENSVSGNPASQDGEVDSVRSRLEQLYADRARLRVRTEDGQRRAVLELPLPPEGRPGPIIT